MWNVSWRMPVLAFMLTSGLRYLTSYPPPPKVGVGLVSHNAIKTQGGLTMPHWLEVGVLFSLFTLRKLQLPALHSLLSNPILLPLRIKGIGKKKYLGLFFNKTVEED